MIHIIYEPLLAGNLIAQIISNFSLDKKQDFSIYNQNDGQYWTQREGLFKIDPNIKLIKGHHYRFKHFLKYDKLIFCSCNTLKEKKLLESRVPYVKHGIMNNPFLIDIRIFYLQELFDYLTEHKKEFYNMPFGDIWDTKKFTSRMAGCLEWLGLSYDEEKIKYAQKQWLKSNIIQRSRLTETEKNAYYDYIRKHTLNRQKELEKHFLKKD